MNYLIITIGLLIIYCSNFNNIFIGVNSLKIKNSLRNAISSKLNEDFICKSDSHGPCREGDYRQYCTYCAEEYQQDWGITCLSCIASNGMKVVKNYSQKCDNLKYVNDELTCDKCLQETCPSGTYSSVCYQCDYDPSVPKMTCLCPLKSGSKFRKYDTVEGPCRFYAFDTTSSKMICADSKICPRNNCRPGNYFTDTCVFSESNPSNYDESTLSAVCQYGYAKPSSIVGRCNDIVINYGEVQCHDKCPYGNCRSGDYLSTCDNCKEESSDQQGKITCRCPYLHYGMIQMTRTTSYNGPCSSLKNVDGYLTCPPCPENNCRPGSYLQNCISCTDDGTNVNCKCKNDFGEYQHSTHSGPCSNLSTYKGYLFCYDQCPLNNCPEGLYKSSCVGCAVDSLGGLSCQCKKGDNSYQYASLAKCSVDKIIMNIEGALYCKKL